MKILVFQPAAFRFSASRADCSQSEMQVYQYSTAATLLHQISIFLNGIYPEAVSLSTTYKASPIVVPNHKPMSFQSSAKAVANEIGKAIR